MQHEGQHTWSVAELVDLIDNRIEANRQIDDRLSSSFELLTSKTEPMSDRDAWHMAVGLLFGMMFFAVVLLVYSLVT